MQGRQAQTRPMQGSAEDQIVASTESPRRRNQYWSGARGEGEDGQGSSAILILFMTTARTMPMMHVLRSLLR